MNDVKISIFDRLWMSSEDKFVKKEQKRIEQQKKDTLTFGEYTKTLNKCRRELNTKLGVEIEHLKIRRSNNLPEDDQIVKIKEIVICILGIQEAELELESAINTKDIEDIKIEFGHVLRKMYKICYKFSIGRKDLNKQLTKIELMKKKEEDPKSFSKRAGLVTDTFVNKLVDDACTVEDCIRELHVKPGKDGEEKEGKTEAKGNEEVKENKEQERQKTLKKLKKSSNETIKKAKEK